MSVRVKKFSTTAEQETNPMTFDTSTDQRETTVDGYTFNWPVNFTINFLDDGVGIAHGAFGAQGVRQDKIPFGSSRS